MAQHSDLTGQKFGRLLVIKEHSHPKAGIYLWECKCDCGNIYIGNGNALRSGNTSSCGCLQREVAGRTSKANALYPKEDERLVRIWRAIHHRCEKPNDKAYKWYGGRGITVCADWEEFNPFRDWARDNGYQDNLTIDRIDSNKGYEPTNCRWVNMIAQNNNKCSNKLLVYRGETKSLSEWCRILDLDYSRTKARLNSLGWSVEDAFEKDRYAQVKINQNIKIED